MRIIVCILVAWLGVAAALWGVHGTRYTWDEADYVDAARLGALANALESGSLGVREFVRFAKAKHDHVKVELPAGYSEQTDPLILRHYHPPFLVWLLALAGDSHDERRMRATQLAGAVALLTACAFSAAALAESAPLFAAIVASLLAAWLAVIAFASISSHGWEAFWAVALAYCLFKTLETQGRFWRIAAGLCVAGAALTLESGAFVAAGGLAVMAARKRWRDVALIAAVCAAAVLALWPGAVLHASLLKIAAFNIYRVKLGHEYSSTFAAVDLGRAFLPAFLAMAFAAVWSLASDRALLRRALPFVAIGGFYLVAMLKFVLDPIYIAAGLAAFFPLAGAAAARAWSARRWTAAASAGALLAGAALFAAAGWTSLGLFADRHWFDSDRKDAGYEELAGLLKGHAAFIDGAHIYRLYFGPELDLTNITQGYDHTSLLLRNGGEYRPMTSADLKGHLVAVQENRSLEWPKLEQGLLADCPLRRVLDLRVYDCTRR